MKYVEATYKGGLSFDHFLNLTKDKTYKGFIRNDFLFIEDDRSQKQNHSHKHLIPHHTCYCIIQSENIFFDIKVL